MEGEPKRDVRWGWVLGRVGPLVALVLLVGGLTLVPDWLLTYPRAVRSRCIEWSLRALVVGYWASVAVAGPGTVVVCALAYRAWRRRRLSRGLGRGALLCVSTLFGLLLIEGAAALWEARAHRMPVLRVDLPGAPADEIDLVVIGESSARGDPFHPWLSIGQIVGWQLERALPGRKVRVDVLAEPGVTLERMHQKLEKLDRRPDVLIVYCGHNEFQARYDWGRDFGHDEAPANPLLDRLYRASLRSPLCRMLYETVNKRRLDEPPSMSKHTLIDPPLCSPSETAAILADFQRRLEAIVSYCDRIGALPVLVIPPGNEGGFEPNRSSYHGRGSAEERAAFTRDFQAARAAEDEPDRALRLYRELLDRQPDFAETHFRIGRLLERQGERDEANRHYSAARDADTFPQRCPTSFQEAYRRVAARHACLLIDGPAELRAVSPTGVLDDNLFHDAQHPSLAGHIALARAVLRELRGHQALGWRDGPVPALEPADCAAHFPMTAEDWALVCKRASWFYQVTAPNRFDPSERKAKERRYAQAEEQVRQGKSPDELRIPGLGVRPAPVRDPDWAVKDLD